MERKLVRFFAKHQLQPTNILYITKANRHTEVMLKDGTLLTTTIPMKDFLSALPEGDYLSITKGVIVSALDIEKIEGNIYTMCDGRTFVGRVRGAGEHKANRKALEHHQIAPNRLISETVYQQFSIMDNLPLPLFVMELQFDDVNHQFEFIIRYCNKAMADFEGYHREEVINRSYHDIFLRPDRARLLTFLDTALTGKSNALKCGHPKTGNTGFTHCFSPGKNLCACMRIEYDN